MGSLRDGVITILGLAKHQHHLQISLIRKRLFGQQNFGWAWCWMPIWRQTSGANADLVLRASNLVPKEGASRRFWCF